MSKANQSFFNRPGLWYYGEAAERHGLDVQVTTRERDAKGFKHLPLRWRIEATFGTQTNRYRRLTRNLEHSPAAAEDAIDIANSHRLLRAYHRDQPRSG